MNNLERLGLITTISLSTIGIVSGLKENNTYAMTFLYKTKEVVNLRVGPGTNYKSVGKVSKGTYVNIVSQCNGWSKLNNGNYIKTEYLTLVNSSYTNKNTYLYTKNNLNLRNGPNTSYHTIVTIPRGSKVSYISESNGWCKVSYGGQIGWCSRKYLSNTKQNSNNKNNSIQLINKIVVVKNRHKIYCYNNGNLIKSMDCAIGKPSTPTPSGTFKVINKIVNPYYSAGNIKGGSSKNPLGKRWIGLTKYYGIHGNNNSLSIGKSVSNGCIRLHNSDVIWLYDRVKQGMTNVVIY